MYRNQLLLKQLGIQQWIPQQQKTVSYTTDVLWRDREVDEAVSVGSIPNTLLQAATAPIVTQTSATTLKTVIPSLEIKKEALVLDIDDHVSFEVNHPQTIHFNYQIMLHEQFILFAQVMNENEQQLFHNIREACHASVFFMQWPLPIEVWEINDHVLQSYLHGFFVQQQGKEVLVLGNEGFECLEQEGRSLKKYASLQQLLESAEQKKALWQALYPLVYDAEINNA